MRRTSSPANSDWRLWLATAAVPLPFALVGLGVAVWAPDLFRQWMQEDGWVEWTTFAAFLAAGVLAFRSGLSAPTRPRLERIVLVGLGAFCLFVAGEEISWGQRLIGFRPPDVFLESNYQQEANLHNFLKNVLDTRWMVAAVALGYGVLTPIAAVVWPRGRPLIPNPVLVPYFALAAGLELFYPFKFTGEFAEAILALAFLVDVLLRTGDASSSRAVLWPVAGPAAAVAAGPLFMPLLQTTLYGPDAEGTRAVTAELQRLTQDIRAGAIQPKMMMKSWVHKRIYTAVQSGYLRLGEAAPSSVGQRTAASDSSPNAGNFFLDHWNQPYWILFRRGFNRAPEVIVYSFGPNRRRDSFLHRSRSDLGSESISGDDVGVAVKIPVGSPATPWFR